MKTARSGRIIHQPNRFKGLCSLKKTKGSVCVCGGGGGKGVVASSPGPILLKLRGEKQGLVATARVLARMR